jgi:hypothetical protein
MAKFQITAPDGKNYEITAPDDADENSVIEFAKTQFAAKPPAIAAAKPSPPRSPWVRWPLMLQSPQA